MPKSKPIKSQADLEERLESIENELVLCERAIARLRDVGLTVGYPVTFILPVNLVQYQFGPDKDDVELILPISSETIQLLRNDLNKQFENLKNEKATHKEKLAKIKNLF